MCGWVSLFCILGINLTSTSDSTRSIKQYFMHLDSISVWTLILCISSNMYRLIYYNQSGSICFDKANVEKHFQKQKKKKNKIKSSQSQAAVQYIQDTVSYKGRHSLHNPLTHLAPLSTTLIFVYLLIDLFFPKKCIDFELNFC